MLAPFQPSLLARFLIVFFRHLYTTFAAYYDIFAELISGGRWRTWILSIVPYIEGPIILELGHGTGQLQAALSENNKLASFALDTSAPMNIIAKNRLRNIGALPRIIKSDASRLPYPDDTFDQLVSTFPSEYIMNPKTLSEVSRVLIKHGQLLVIPMARITGKSPIDRLLAFIFAITGETKKSNGHFSSLIKDAGFDVEEIIIHIKSSQILLISATRL